jgi:hypothetical protein
MLIRKLFTRRVPQGLLTAMLAVALLAGILAVFPGVALAGTVTWSGQGVQCDEFDNCVLNLELCGVENGADVDGPYLLWVLTGQNITSATIAISNCGTETGGTMTQSGGGAWKYISAYCSPTTVQATATYTGTPRNPQLVISHGCKPVESANLWCSPGYWGHAADLAWAQTDYTRDTLYNDTSCKDTPLKAGAPTNPTLGAVVATGAAATYGAAAFNCVGQLLTNTLCGGGQLNPNCPASADICPDACPFDNAGHLKDDAPAVCQPPQP